ncbi:MAG: hypothetical protein A3F11_00410 [Gammaproteobacteria bacterium RIFCSPHIGHO2_12_FULL_37_14]|nr:MAG: hypothetical protein A3F11_00410 [Gammaproteobacteria bacterium RIFCSPHIGHO2_12_FULL_37_14]
MKIWEKYGPGTANAYFKLIEAAKLSDIKVIGIDVRLGIVSGGDERLKRSNPHWEEVIRMNNRVLSPDDKYMILGGDAHIHTVGSEIDGVDKLLGGIPTIIIQVGSPKVITTEGTYVDYILKIPDVSSSIEVSSREVSSSKKLELGSMNF